MLRLSSSLTSLLMLLGLFLPQISATLGSMSLPDDVVPGGQTLEHLPRSPAGPQADQSSAEETDHLPSVQLEPRQGVKSAKCEVFPVDKYYRVVVDFWNWDPAKDGKAEELEKQLQKKCGKDNFHGFWWRKYPPSKDTPDTRFMFNVPYPARDRMKGDMYQLISDAVFEYTGKKIRAPCYMF